MVPIYSLVPRRLAKHSDEADKDSGTELIEVVVIVCIIVGCIGIACIVRSRLENKRRAELERQKTLERACDVGNSQRKPKPVGNILKKPETNTSDHSIQIVNIVPNSDTSALV